MAKDFVDSSTSLWNGINAHPNELETYGKGLLALSTKCGLSGLKYVTKRHLFVTDKKPHRLMWSSIQPKVAVKRLPTHLLSVGVSIPKDSKKRAKIASPTLQNVQVSFYGLLSMAILGDWHDGSNVTSSQVRFLMRLSGLRVPNDDEVCQSFKKLRNSLKGHEHDTGEATQGACQIIPLILKKIEPWRSAIILNIIQKQETNDPNHYAPIITTKKNYIEEAKQIPTLNADKATRELKDLPDDYFLGVSKDFRWHTLYGKEVIETLNGFIYYLE